MDTSKAFQKKQTNFNGNIKWLLFSTSIGQTVRLSSISKLLVSIITTNFLELPMPQEPYKFFGSVRVDAEIEKWRLLSSNGQVCLFFYFFIFFLLRRSSV